MELKPHEKFVLSIEEAHEYSGIGEKRLREIMDNDRTLDWILNVGNTRKKIKRPLFEQWILKQKYI